MPKRNLEIIIFRQLKLLDLITIRIPLNKEHYTKEYIEERKKLHKLLRNYKKIGNQDKYDKFMAELYITNKRYNKLK